jgi:uroporphyrinogen decarboxylase
MQKSTSSKPLLLAAAGQPTPRLPVWFLRQAGRYLPEYQAIRKNLSFVDLCKNPSLASEVTLQPLRRFDVDAAIIFSDILIPPMAMGMDLRFDAGHGPLLSPPCRGAAAVKSLLGPACVKELGFIGEAIAKTKTFLSPTQAMIGFAGAPFTVASYMIEGKGSKTFSEVKRFLLESPQAFQDLLDKVAEVTLTYLQMQVSAGADALMLFDSWASFLTPHSFATHALPAIKRCLAGLGVPVIYFPGQGMQHFHLLHHLSESIDVLAVDWRLDIHAAARQLAWEPVLQGNLDPMILSFGDEATVRREVRRVLEARPGIFNVGHGLLPTTKVEAMLWAIDEVRQGS